jgi:hypothetical protein
MKENITQNRESTPEVKRHRMTRLWFPAVSTPSSPKIDLNPGLLQLEKNSSGKSQVFGSGDQNGEAQISAEIAK